MRDACPPAQCGSAERDGVLVEVFGHWGEGQVLNAGTAGAHPENRHLIGIAAEGGDVVLAHTGSFFESSAF